MNNVEHAKIREAVHQTIQKMEEKYKQQIKEEREAIMEEASKIATQTIKKKKEQKSDHSIRSIWLVEYYDIKELDEESNKLLNLTKSFDTEEKNWGEINLPDNTVTCQIVGFLARETKDNIYIAKKKIGKRFYGIHTIPKAYIIKTEEL